MATTAQPRVFVTRCREAFPADKMVILESKYQVIYWKEDSVIPREDLMSSLHDKDALFCLLTDKIDSEVLDAAPNIKVIATMSVGYDHLGTVIVIFPNVINLTKYCRSGDHQEERHPRWLHSRGSHRCHRRTDCGSPVGHLQETDGGQQSPPVWQVVFLESTLDVRHSAEG